MNINQYFKTLTDELISLRDRVRYYIDDANWQSDGEWKESVIRAILKRHLPDNIGVGRGFVVNIQQASTQIDVLLYDKSKPTLFQDGDFVLITPDSVKGVIEIKTKIWHKNELREALNKLSDISQLILPTVPYNEARFFGLFSYEAPNFNTNHVLEILHDCVNGELRRIINCLSFGKDFFVRYWPSQPNSADFQNYKKWHSYNLENRAPAYFIHNVIDHLLPAWTIANNEVWYPENGKENYKIDDKFLYRPDQITE